MEPTHADNDDFVGENDAHEDSLGGYEAVVAAHVVKGRQVRDYVQFYIDMWCALPKSGKIMSREVTMFLFFLMTCV